MGPFGNGVQFGGGFVLRGANRGFGWWAVPRLVLALALLALVVLGCVALGRYVRDGRVRSVGPAQASVPESILAERFARGEIDADELRSRLDVLRAARGAPPG